MASAQQVRWGGQNARHHGRQQFFGHAATGPAGDEIGQPFFGLGGAHGLERFQEHAELGGPAHEVAGDQADRVGGYRDQATFLPIQRAPYQGF
ncbi:MAG: hypothetical protein IPN59_10080 [Holophaga sp.]|nr:hypothetical protein [Holophaga sp.]